MSESSSGLLLLPHIVGRSKIAGMKRYGQISAKLVSLSYRSETLAVFLQAEAGIRYYKVTGVQTCALPISSSFVAMSSVRASLRLRYPDQRQRTRRRSAALRTLPCRSRPWVGARAESRRARGRIGSSGSRATTSDRKSTRSELQSPCNLVCRLLLEKKKNTERSTVVTMTSS